MNYKVAELCFSVEGYHLSVLDDFQVDEEAQWQFHFTDDFKDDTKVHPYLTMASDKPVIAGVEDQKIRGRIDNQSKKVEMAKGPNATYLMRSALHWVLEMENCFWVHACGLSLDGCGILLPGASGAGKSTVAAQFSKEELLSEEIVAVKEGMLYKTPFRVGRGEERHCDVVLFPVHDETFSLKELSVEKAFAKMLPRVSMGAEGKEQVETVMGCLEEFLRRRPLFDMHFSLEDDLSERLKEELWIQK